jgi:hypothetical protein
MNLLSKEEEKKFLRYFVNQKIIPYSLFIIAVCFVGGSFIRYNIDGIFDILLSVSFFIPIGVVTALIVIAIMILSVKPIIDLHEMDEYMAVQSGFMMRQTAYVGIRQGRFYYCLGDAREISEINFIVLKSEDKPYDLVRIHDAVYAVQDASKLEAMINKVGD